MFIIEQGDVLFFKEEIPKTATEELQTNIVMHGEHTGHAHRLCVSDFTEMKSPKQKKFQIFKDPNSNVIYLRAKEEVDLTHEEHKKIILPPGDYRIGQVREKGFFDDMINPVAD